MQATDVCGKRGAETREREVGAWWGRGKGVEIKLGEKAIP